jgi:dTDP-4-dehydrorhamnose 3,5-epimerase
VTLTADNGLLLYIPEGCAHGYLTLAPDTELMYFASSPYAPAAATGVRYNDPAFGIAWPDTPAVVSQADRSWPDFTS